MWLSHGWVHLLCQVLCSSEPTGRGISRRLPVGAVTLLAHGERCPMTPMKLFGPREPNHNDTHYTTLSSALLRLLKTGSQDKQLLVMGPGKGFVHGVVFAQGLS